MAPCITVLEAARADGDIKVDVIEAKPSGGTRRRGRGHCTVRPVAAIDRRPASKRRARSSWSAVTTTSSSVSHVVSVSSARSVLPMLSRDELAVGCWVGGQANQQLKQELGPGAFEGRSWTALHRHALKSRIAFA
jgi:hypothetical protein